MADRPDRPLTFMERIDQAGLEDGSILMEIQQMALQRAGVVGVKLTELQTDHHTPIIEVLKTLRNQVYALAPNFVNLEYPYWKNSWVDFPKMFSTVFWTSPRPWREPSKVDDISMDEEHSLNTILQVDSSFGEVDIDTYRDFLKRVVWWLQRFRYVKATYSWYDMTFKRHWDWVKSWDRWDWDYEYSGYENGVYFSDTSTLDTQLRSRQDGLIDNSSPRQIGTNGHKVSLSEDGFMQKFFTYDGRYYFAKPMTEAEAGEHVYNLEHIPHNLITKNPAGYYADVLWFVIPNVIDDGSFDERGASGRLVEIEKNWAVTDIEFKRHLVWGEQQYSADEYGAVEGSGEAVLTMNSFFSDEPKETAKIEQKWETAGRSRLSTKHYTRTNWTDDGSRSVVVEDTTTQDTNTQQPYFSTLWCYYFARMSFGGRVTQLQEEPPMFNAGTVEPHGSLTYTVCEQNDLPAPNYSFTYKYSPNGTYCYDVDTWSHMYYHGDTTWWPILDYGEYLTELPEEEEE